MGRRVASLISASVLAALAGASQARAAGTPALVVDADSGRVLYSDRATDPWYPASITKLMTTYVALDQVRAGKLSMNSLLTLSARAAAEPPSKMGFKPGTQITLENALKIMMVKSANDIAMMVGENVGGSVEDFAVMMNDAARRLGMRESRWVNPNGLPDERQQTSARDMAVLARAILREFPDDEPLFHIGALKLGNQIIRNHNGMLGRYPGADGMKTGFICMGGFNIVASATHNGRRLIAVVMGYPSAKERDLRTADLFDTGFGALGWGAQSVNDLPPSGVMSPVNMRDQVCGPHRRQPEDDDETAVVASRAPTGGNSDNPIGSLFSPLTYAVASATNGPIASGRRTLGPRVEFTPEPIWLGPSPGSTPDAGDAVAVRPVGIAARPVKTKVLARAGLGTPVQTSTQAFVPASATSATNPGASISTLSAKTRPGGRKALQANLDPKPAAETKPAAEIKPAAETKPAAESKPAVETKQKLGAIGGKVEARERLGGISLKPTLAASTGKDAATADGKRPSGAAQARAVPAEKTTASRRPSTAAAPADE